MDAEHYTIPKTFLNNRILIKKHRSRCCS